MILVDTSVWIDHLRHGDEVLSRLLERNQVGTHPFVVGELACGNLRNRPQILNLLRALPRFPVADDAEVLFFIETHRLMRRGIGYIDAHLLAATQLAIPAKLWTRDRRFATIAQMLNLAYDPIT